MKKTTPKKRRRSMMRTRTKKRMKQTRWSLMLTTTAKWHSRIQKASSQDVAKVPFAFIIFYIHFNPQMDPQSCTGFALYRIEN